MEHKSDQEIWKRISDGDAETFDAFYRETAPRLVIFLNQIIGNRQGAEDVTQETFTYLWTRPAGYEPDRGSLRAYLFGIGKKRAANWWRRQKISEQLNDSAATTRPEIGSLVGDAFGRLPEEQRALLWLREVEGYSYEELAEILDVPLGTVRSRLFTAREALRTIWQSKPQENKRNTGRGAA